MFSMYLLIVDCILILIVVRTYPRRCGTRCRGSRGLCGKAAALRARGEATRHIVNLVPLLFCDRPHCWLHLNPVINYVLWLIACLLLVLIKCCSENRRDVSLLSDFYTRAQCARALSTCSIVYVFTLSFPLFILVT